MGFSSETPKVHQAPSNDEARFGTESDGAALMRVSAKLVASSGCVKLRNL
jgi:hypothetical protein